MRVVYEGRGINAMPWWVDRMVDCPQCSRRVQLEKDDDRRVEVMITDKTFTLICGNCRTHVVITKGEG